MEYYSIWITHNKYAAFYWITIHAYVVMALPIFTAFLSAPMASELERSYEGNVLLCKLPHNL